MNNSQDTSLITLRDIWEVFLGNIWVFIVSVVLCVAASVAIIIATPPTYQRTASILIKDDKQGQSMAGAEFANMGLVQSNTDINNEIYVLSTKALMSEVVKRLSLNYNYSYKYKGVREVDLYNSAPFVVKVDSVLTDVNLSFDLKTDGKNAYTIKNFVVNGIEISNKTVGEFGVPLECGDGFIVIEKGVYMPVDVVDNEYNFSKNSVQSAAAAYVSALTVKLRNTGASIIDMSITLGSIQKADDILNTLISVYNENWIKDKNLITLSTTSFINDRLSIIERELGTVDKDISNYKSENLLPDVGAVAGMNLQSSNEILKKQIDLNNQLSMANYLLQYIENGATGGQLLPVNSGIESSSINGQILSYNELLLKKNTLLANSSINNPIVADLIIDLDAMKKVLILSVNELRTTLQMQISSAQQEELVTRKKISNNPTQELYLLSTGREQMIKEQLYLYLLQKREENELNQAFTAYNTKVLSLADGSGVPIAPQKKIILLFGIVIGLILPIIYLIIKSSLDTLVKSKKDIEGLNIPYIGSIPQIVTNKGKKAFKQQNMSNLIIDGSRSVITEAFRVVRTNLDFMTSENNEGGQVIQLISMNPGSGKTFITSNLGYSMALKDAKVLIIDADIRKSTLSNLVNAPKLGVSDYLSGKKDNVDELILKGVTHENLDVLPVGKTPPNPSELLLKPRFADLIAEMKARYDYIFLDCPPVEVVPDAAIIGKLCDTAIFVVRAGNLDKRLLPDIETIYESKKYNNMCLLLNDVCYSGKGYYGYRRYGYYGYGYGYGNEGAAK